MQIATLAAGSLEKALASLLKYHPDPNPLASWHGQVIQLTLAPLPFDLFLILSNPIQVYSSYGGDPHCRLSLSLNTLKQIQAGAPLSELMKQGSLEIQGDMQLAGKLAGLLSAIEPDLAAPLSRFMGDAMAYRVERAGRRLTAEAARQLGRLQKHGGTLLQEELRIAPGIPEFRHFSGQVTELQQRSEVLLQRLDALESTR
ncbi:ubiquinone biosynthesis accessory factor UbiJ [Ferrimonas gelatinilytica]|uniref:Ubiquinone biosynthesis accessory factor UbiJ n=1 Tax=Ferrimonas gelatinilytica TaxID=1255257 RepID=A0ABP9SFT2_9GAMM